MTGKRRQRLGMQYSPKEAEGHRRQWPHLIEGTGTQLSTGPSTDLATGHRSPREEGRQELREKEDSGRRVTGRTKIMQDFCSHEQKSWGT